jgi:hypothetical protein
MYLQTIQTEANGAQRDDLLLFERPKHEAPSQSPHLTLVNEKTIPA